MLKVILITVTVLVLFVFLAVALFIRKVKRILKDAAAGMGASLIRCRVSLKPEPAPQWNSASQIDQWSQDFLTCGFEEIGAFTVPELGGLLLKGFCHRNERLYGVIYDHTKIKPTFDIVCDYEDGSGLTGANTTSGENIEGDPRQEKIRVDGASVAQILDLVLKGMKAMPRNPTTPENFTADFCRSYAQSMNFRMKRGGVSREEIKKQAQKKGESFTDEQLEQTYLSMREDYTRELRSACVAQYLDESKLPAVEWEKIRYRTFAIPETFEWKEVAETLGFELTLSEEQTSELEKYSPDGGNNALEMIDSALQNKLASLKLQKLGEVKEPVRAFIFVGPENN